MDGDTCERRQTVANRLRRARGWRFVGRAEELQRFRSALAAPGTSFTVLFLHGPGEVGKSTLLGEFAEVAHHGGSTPITLDARTIQPTGAAFVGALGAAMGLAEDASPVGELATRTRPVLLLDTYELLAPLDDWLREQLLPALPGDAVVVIAGRTAPSSRWFSDQPPPRGHAELPSDRGRAGGGARAGAHDDARPPTHALPHRRRDRAPAGLRRHDSRVLADAPDVVRVTLKLVKY